MLKVYDFKCNKCETVFEDTVEGVEGIPEECPKCSSTKGFTKLIGSPNLVSTIIVDYPGSKKLKAGYQHTHNLEAEKKGRQISMHGAYKDE